MRQKQSMANFFAAKPSSDSLSASVDSAEILICAYISEHNIAFKAMDHLVDTLKKMFPDSKVRTLI